MTVIAFDDVTKRFGDSVALDKVTFSVPAGGIFGFLGGNGAGKTTSLRMMVDILHPTSGQIRMFGRPPSREANRKIGYLPEERGLYQNMTGRENLLYFASLKGMAMPEAKRRAQVVFERFGVADVADQKVKTLSKGTTQKFQVAAAILPAPPLLLLDEPFSGLDPVAQTELEAIFRDLAQEGTTIVFSTHIMQQAERLCGRLLLMAKGRLLFEGTVAEANARVPTGTGLHDAFVHMVTQSALELAR